MTSRLYKQFQQRQAQQNQPQAFNGSVNNQNGQALKGLMSGLAAGNPDQVVESLKATNPDFANFIEQNKNKTPEQVAAENNINLGALLKFFK